MKMSRSGNRCGSINRDEEFFLIIRWEPIRDETGRVTGVGSATVDLTPMKLAEEALRKAHDELEKRVQERTIELSAGL